MAVGSLVTERLVLREWRDSDLPVFAALNADPETMRYFSSTLTRDQTHALAERIRGWMAASGWGLWAVEVTGGEPFIGFVGLNAVPEQMPFAPALEVGWRLARSSWGNGYATEAARTAVAFAFDTVGVDELVSMTAVGNQRSRAVMERLGMTRNPADDFDHPLVTADRVRAHVLYRLPRP